LGGVSAWLAECGHRPIAFKQFLELIHLGQIQQRFTNGGSPRQTEPLKQVRGSDMRRGRISRQRVAEPRAKQEKAAAILGNTEIGRIEDAVISLDRVVSGPKGCNDFIEKTAMFSDS
jgi:hypothetical protein